MIQRGNFDSLTGLANRALFHERLRCALDRAKLSKRRIGVLFIDLDDFKSVNDSLGHQVGDDLLRCVAFALRRTVRDRDRVARLGGDEFTVLIEAMDQTADASRAAERIVSALQHPVSVNNHELAITSSVGVAVYPDDATEIDDLLRLADAAMFKAKRAGRNKVKIH